MDENIKGIVRIAWNAYPVNTIDYLDQHISSIEDMLEKTINLIEQQQNTNSPLHNPFASEHYIAGLLYQRRFLENTIDEVKQFKASLK